MTDKVDRKPLVELVEKWRARAARMRSGSRGQVSLYDAAWMRGEASGGEVAADALERILSPSSGEPGSVAGAESGPLGQE